MEMMLWNALLTTLLGLLGWTLKTKSEEIDRLQIQIGRAHV